MKPRKSYARSRSYDEGASEATIDVKAAAKIAAEYFASLYSERDYSDLQLEEVELTEDGKYWLITLGYSSRDTTILGLAKARKYKLFKIDVKTGKVWAMKVRSVA
jgi:hypothetical protein